MRTKKKPCFKFDAGQAAESVIHWRKLHASLIRSREAGKVVLVMRFPLRTLKIPKFSVPHRRCCGAPRFTDQFDP
jgi:hypothetical protein